MPTNSSKHTLIRNRSEARTKKNFIMLKKVIIFITSILLVTLLGVASFSISVINELPLTEIQQIRPKVAQSLYESKDILDEGSQLYQKDLSVFWTWNESDVGFADEMSFKYKARKIFGALGRVYPKENIVLSPLEVNHCDQIYCLQHRMLFHDIPSLLWRGLIGIEDYRFLEHKGIDPRSLVRAIWHDLKVFKLEQGGSTLTQQLVKNLFYTSEKKFSRKLKEMVVSAYLEFKFDKEQILQMYFNEVMWGSIAGVKLKGIKAAAMGYFNKKPIELTPYEVSILISLLKGPYYYSPATHLERLRERVGVVYSKLRELNLFSKEARVWNEKQWKVWGEEVTKRNGEVLLKSLYYLTKSKSPPSFKYFVLIKNIEQLKVKLKRKYPKKDLAIKSVLFQVSDKAIKRKFEYYTKYERQWDRALNVEKHQIGSTLKPILYWLLVKNGLSLQDEVETAPLTLKLKSGVWSPREAHKEKKKRITYAQALIHSLNRPVIRGIENVVWEAMEKELSPLIPQLLTPLSEYPAQLLGSIEMSLDELASLYATFLQAACYEGIGSSVISTLSDPTATTIRYRVGEKLGQMRFFGKTGTSNNGHDNWFIGYDGKELLVTWVGIESGRNRDENLNLYGSNSAFLIFKDYFMNRGKLFNEMVCR